MPPTYSFTSLEAVNRVLRAGQINPVTSVSTPPLDRYTTRAVTILEEELRRTLTLGWDFNTDYDYPLVPVAGIISVPADSLKVDVWPQNLNGKDIVVRAGVLYNRTANTTTFTDASIKAEVVRYVAFDNCPIVVQDYVIACAKVEFTSTVTVDPETRRALIQEKFAAWAELKRTDTEQASLNLRSRYPIGPIADKWPVMGSNSTAGDSW